MHHFEAMRTTPNVEMTTWTCWPTRWRKQSIGKYSTTNSASVERSDFPKCWVTSTHQDLKVVLADLRARSKRKILSTHTSSSCCEMRNTYYTHREEWIDVVPLILGPLRDKFLQGAASQWSSCKRIPPGCIGQVIFSVSYYSHPTHQSTYSADHGKWEARSNHYRGSEGR
jgi:hypothetical protein